MSTVKPNPKEDALDAEPRWKDLYTIGGIACILSELVIVLGIVAYFIQPYLPGSASTQEIFAVIQGNKLAGLMGLDFMLLLGNLVGILIYLVLYASLRRVNGSHALIALVLGLMAALLIIPARPIVELFSLSRAYAAANTEVARNAFLAAGETLLSVFSGTAWAANTLLGGISLLISAVLMLRSRIFGKWTAWVGIVTNAAVLAFMLPGGIGALLLFLSLPGYLVWYVQIARRLFGLARLARTAASPGA
jgi:hypothetical protein